MIALFTLEGKPKKELAHLASTKAWSATTRGLSVFPSPCKLSGTPIAQQIFPAGLFEKVRIMHGMKQILVGTNTGRFFLFLRDKVELINASLFRLETLGTLANDQMATKLVTGLCQPGKTFIDVGAHIGSIISEVKFKDPSIKIIAIEAIPEKARNLRQHFPAIVVHECAAGETTGNVSFFINTRQSGYSSLGKQLGADQKILKEITVQLDRLDNLVLCHDIDVIKIDVEGAELGVLRGCEKIINNSRPTIMFESAPQSDDGLGYTKSGIFNFFADHAYVVLVPNRLAHDDPGLTEEEFIRSHLYPRATTNYFAVSAPRREEIRNRARKLLGIVPLNR